LDDNGNAVGTSYVVYDDTFQYQYVTKGSPSTRIQPKDLISTPKAHFLGDVPIVEYPNNEWRIGDFEIVITILNEINKLHSDRGNSIEQVVNALIVFIGCHLKTKEENEKAGQGSIADYDSLKANGAIELPNANGGKADVKYVSSSVNQDEAETFAQTLIDYAYAISGIPDRKQKSSGSGGDTGDAVYLRDGYQSLEIVARVKERNFKKSERQSLRMVCKILKIFNGIDLKPMQVDVKFIRNRTNNLVNKSQAAANLQSTGVFAPEDIIQLIGVTDDPKQMAERGQKYKDEQMQKATTQFETQAIKSVGKENNPDDTTDGEE
jgi:SPP1 family phage portal protein